MIGLRVRVFLTSAVLLVTFVATVGTWIANRTGRNMVIQIEQRLVRESLLIAQLLPAKPGQDAGLADAIAIASDARVTVLDPDGVVLLDSDADVARMDNHLHRPEVQEALGPRGFGVRHRASDTVGVDMVYAAVPWQTGGGTGIVRLALPLEEVRAEVGRLRRALALAVVAGLLGSLLLAGLFSQSATRDLRNLVRRTRTATRLQPHLARDEVALLSASFEHLSAELQAAVEALAAEQARLTSMLAGMREGVLAIEADGTVLVANPAAQGMLGHIARPGDPVEEISPLIADLVAACREGGRPVSQDLGASDAHAPVARRMVATADPLPGQGAVVVITDVTESRRLDRVRRDFVANVSHELRTPVAVIQSNAEALWDGGLEHPKLARQFVGAIHRHAERLGEQIRDLLDLARIEDEDGFIELRPTLLAPVARAVVDLFGARIRERGHDVRIDIPVGLTALADPVAIEHALSNLVDNAVKYTPPGGNIRVQGRLLDDVVALEVADDGPGIEPEHRHRVFERFYRVDPGRSRSRGGTGLGLSIVRHLVERLEGEVVVEANLPRGTRFVIHLRPA